MDTPAAAPGTSVFDGLLTQCRDLVAGQLDKAIAGMLEKADAALSELATKTQNRETQKLYLEAKDAVRTQRAAMEKRFRTSYLSEFKQRTNKGKKTGGSFADFELDDSTFELSLVADDDLEETLKFNEMAAKLRRICEDECNALDQRVGVLLGDADLQAEDSPLSPQAICHAYKKTCRKLVESVAVRGVLLKLFDDHVLDEVRSIYKELNELLVQNAILPKIRYGVTKKKDGKKGPKGDKDEDDENVGGDVFAALQKLFAGKGGGAGAGGGGPGGTGVGGGPVLAGAELLGSLTKLQLDGLAALAAGGGQPGAGGPVTGTTNVLHELKSSEVGASMGQMDAMTLDVVAMLFDQLFDDAKIPLGAKGLIGRLQIPMLKVAIADKEFFSKKTHPARLLLEKLGEIAERLPADFNTGSALFGQLESILQGLISGYKDNVEIFSSVREQLIALMASEDQRIEQEARSAAERVIQEESLAVAKSVAQEEVRKRVAGTQLPGAVLEFIVGEWLKLMVMIHARRGTTSEAWQHALEAIDQLIWSVQPKDTAEDRRKLGTVVPPLLNRLGAGMQVAGIAYEVRESLFAELMETHTRIMSTPLRAKGADEPPPAPVQVGDAEAALDFTASITVKNPYGGGEVQVDDLDFASASPDTIQQGRAAKEVALLDTLKQGDWIEFKEAEKEARRPARLLFISPRKTRYIFSDRSEKEYIECTRSEMARRMRTGEATMMEEVPEVPFFERIMGGVMSKMRGAAAPA